MSTPAEQQILIPDLDASENAPADHSWLQPFDFNDQPAGNPGNDAPRLPGVFLDRDAQPGWSNKQLRQAYERGASEAFMNLQQAINSGAIQGLGLPAGPDDLNYYDKKMLGPYVPVTGTPVVVNAQDGLVVNRQTGERMGVAELADKPAQAAKPLIPVAALGGIANLIDGVLYDSQTGLRIGTIAPLSQAEFEQAAASGASDTAIDSTVASPTTSVDQSNDSSTSTANSTVDNTADNTNNEANAQTNPRPNINDGENTNGGGNSNGGSNSNCAGGNMMNYLRGFLGIGMMSLMFAGIARGGMGGMMMLPSMMLMMPQMFRMFRSY